MLTRYPKLVFMNLRKILCCWFIYIFTKCFFREIKFKFTNGIRNEKFPPTFYLITYLHIYSLLFSTIKYFLSLALYKYVFLSYLVMGLVSFFGFGLGHQITWVFPTGSNRFKSGQVGYCFSGLGRVQVAKRSGFSPWVLGFRVRVPITTWFGVLGAKVGFRVFEYSPKASLCSCLYVVQLFIENVKKCTMSLQSNLSSL